MTEPLLVIPSFVRSVEDVQAHLTTLQTLREHEPTAPILVVDDGSPAPELADLIERESAGLESVEWIRKEENEGFARTVNVGLRMALEQGRDAVLVNADMEFTHPFVANAQRQTRIGSDEPADVVGGLLLYPNGLIQHAGVFFSLLHRCFEHIYKYAPANLPEAHHARVCPVTGALQLIRHSTLQTIGLYDEGFRLGWEDVDYCIRTFLAGGECVYQPGVTAVHHESMFRGRPSPKIADWQNRSWLYFIEKYKEQSFAQFVPSLI